MMGFVANAVQIVGLDLIKLVVLIVRASENARMHKKNCRNFAQHIQLIGNLLEQLKLSEVADHFESREPLIRLEKALHKGLVLVKTCQKKSYLYLLAMGWRIVSQFNSCQSEIDRLVQLIPLISLVENNRALDQLRAIQRDQRTYDLDEEEKRLWGTLLKNQRTIDETMELQQSLSYGYPDISLYEALRMENENLHRELQFRQSLADIDQCDIIRHLIDVVQLPYQSDNNINSAGQLEVKLDGVQKWHHGLFDCHANPLLCISTFICPCITFIRIASTVTDKEVAKYAACNNLIAFTLGLGCFCYTASFRRTLRKRLNIPGGSCDDFWAHALCFCCALVQEAEEMRILRQLGGMSAPPSQCMKR